MKISTFKIVYFSLLSRTFLPFPETKEEKGRGQGKGGKFVTANLCVPTVPYARNHKIPGIK